MGDELVAIGGREFELGAVYAPRDPRGPQLRRLVAYAPVEGWRGGRAETLIIGRTARPPFCDVVIGAWWACWAGERVASPPRRPAGRWTTTSSRRGRGPPPRRSAPR